MSKNYVWCEKYRPEKIDDVILPKSLKSVFSDMVKNDELQNMIFTGTAGLGKTTVAIALCKEMNCEYLKINGSEEGNIDTLRNKLKRFASTSSLMGNKKVIILDEADGLNANSFQPALRAFIEEFSSNCRFILTCNSKNKIIAPLHSRCSVYEFNVTGKEKEVLAVAFLKRLEYILKEEDVKYSKNTLVQVIMRHFPDWRRVINECQRFSGSGELSPAAITSSGTDDQFNNLFNHIKAKDFTKMRKWVVSNIDLDTPTMLRGIYNRMDEYIDKSSQPQLILIIADYMYKSSFVADNEINAVACFTEIMANVEFK